MAKHVLDGKLTYGWQIEGNDGTWTVTESGKIVSIANDPTETAVGIYEDDVLSDNYIELDGSIMALSRVSLGIYARGDNTEIVIGSSARIDASYGIVTDGENAGIFNAGSISSVDFGILAYDNVKVVNAGQITAHQGVTLKSDESAVINQKGCLILGDTAIYSSGAETTIKNKGMLSGAEDAIVDVHGSMTVINRGTIVGIVNLGDGNDIFQNEGGKVLSAVTGGKGNDLYSVDSKSVHIIEADNEGFDSIFTTSDYQISGDAGEIEFIRARGSKNVSLEGNSSDQVLIGNSGNNNISANIGADSLRGGSGNDRLTGGAGSDIFDFRVHCGKDVITDFEQGTDLIKLASYDDLTFADLTGRITDEIAGTVIKLDGRDRILLEGVHGITLTVDDFLI